MILCLTYHKIVSSPAEEGDRPDFYSVTATTLAQQIERTLSAGFQPLELDRTPPAMSPADRRFILTFDDGTADHFEIVPDVLRRFDLKGVFFVPTAKLNRPGYLTDDQVRALAGSGHVIGCHSHEHKRLDTLSETEIHHQLRTSCGKLAELTGHPPVLFAPPGGFTNRNLNAAALGQGLRVIRTMKWGFNRTPDFTALETVPINRHTNAGQFERILQGKQPRLLYFGKQAAKALVPAKTYERLRRWVFNLGRKH
jgi:peptidoglycan/xylan/chitin deacetylase (PgdA/CDA1 family)